jgi:hypothetical protein
MKKVPLYRQTSGLNNADDPTRLVYDTRKGVTELGAAVNIDIDGSGRFSLRRGYEELMAFTGAHSLWSDAGVCFFVVGQAMYQLYADWSFEGIRSGLTPKAPMSYVHMDGKTYYANGFENGINHSDASWAWVGEEYVGPESIFAISMQPPVGHLLEIMSGRMLIAAGSVMWFSMPFAYGHYRKSRGYVPFESKITMMRTLPDGLWVSDEKGVYWLNGHDPEQWVRANKAPYPAIPGTSVLIDGGKLGDGQILGMCVLFTTTRGICVGGPEGFFRNLTERKLVYPKSPCGAAVLIGDKYIVTMQP